MSDIPFSRDAFPSLENITYLNTAAEGIPPACVHDALEEYWRDKLLGMDGREHHFARRDACKVVVARMLGHQPEEVSFCSCSAEAYNLLATALDFEEGDEIVVNDLDFPSGATPWLGKRGAVVRVWRSRNGALDMRDLKWLLTRKTRLVQVSLVSFYNGYRLHWPEFRDTVRSVTDQALISVDVTQAFGRIELDCFDADCIISSTHKWIMALHGGCIVAIPTHRAAALTTHAGGWYHLDNAFDADRFERAVPKPGANSYSVGMPNFASIYALDAALRYVEATGVKRIARHADPLMQHLSQELPKLGLDLMAPHEANYCSGILAFRHAQSAQIHAALQAANVHIMHHAGRLRVSVHGYNSHQDIECLLSCLKETLRAL